MRARSEIIRRLALLRRSSQRRDKLSEVVVKGRYQIVNLIKYNEGLRFNEVVLPKVDRADLIPGLRFGKIFHADPALLYYVFYHSKPLPSGKTFSAKELDLTHEDRAILSDPKIAHSLMAATLPRPEESLPENPKLVLCLDKVIFPDNVGALIRSAQGVGGVDAIISTEGTCDFFGWKVLEASKALGFSIPKKSAMSHSDVLAYARVNNLLPVVGSSSVGMDPKEIKLSPEHKGVMVIVGNEKHGPSKEFLDVAVRARIPIETRMNSLNAGVAGGLLLHIAKSFLSNP